MERRITRPLDQRYEVSAELARKVTYFVDSAQTLATDIPGLTLYQHFARTAPAPVIYEPSVAFCFSIHPDTC